MKNWVVLQAETCETFGGLWPAVKFFDDYEKALKFVEDVVRNEWGTLIPTKKDGWAKLADSKGKFYPDGSVKYADVYYSEDGEVAWVRNGFNGECGKTIKVVRYLEGERMS